MLFILIIFGIIAIATGTALYASPAKPADTTETRQPVEISSREKHPVYGCKHNWIAYYEALTCGYKPGDRDLACRVKSDINWLCTKCGDVRCGTHSQDHWGHNSGWAYKGDVSPS